MDSDLAKPAAFSRRESHWGSERPHWHWGTSRGARGGCVCGVQGTMQLTSGFSMKPEAPPHALCLSLSLVLLYARIQNESS